MLGAAFLAVLVWACTDAESDAPAEPAVESLVQEGTPFTDPRDNRVYKTVKVGERVWMAENMKFYDADKKGDFYGKSWCYGNVEENCETYGRLYHWSAAAKVCPAGWHLPSKEEVKRRLHEDPALHVDALALVLGGGEEELPERHVARVEVDRAQSRSAVLLGDLELHVVCPKFDVDDGLAVHQVFVAEERADRRCADFVYVVVGEREGEGVEIQVLGAELFAQSRPYRFDRLRIFCEDAHDNLDLGRCPEFAHAR